MKYNSFIKIFILHIYIFLIFFSNYSSSQYFETGYPYINNIPPSEYGYESQNFSIVQDNLGILFIANLNGVIEYDGTSWNLIKVPGAYSLAAGTDGIIYVGGYNEFGYLNRNIYGCIQYFSFIHELDTRYSGFGTVKEALACTNEIFFSTQTKLFRWNFKNVECIDSADNYLKIFKADNILYEYKSGIGLLEYAGYNFTMVIEGDFFSKKKIIEILPFNNSTLLVSTFRQAQCNAGSTHSNTGKNLLIKTESEKGFYLYCSDSIIPFNTKADDFFEENKISCATILSGTYYAFGTNRCGLIIINNKGEILYNINNATGLYDDDIRDIYIDNSFNMWLATNNGISRVEVPDAFSYFDRTSGLSGGAKEIIRHNGILYVATTQGLFYLDRQKELLASCRPSLRFLPVKGIDSDGNTFFSTCSKLFLATDNGLYKISDSTSALIIDGLHEIVIESEKYPGHLYNGRSDGLAVLKYENGSLSEDCKIKNINSHIRTIVEEDNGTLWLGTDYEGVYMVDLSSEWNTEPDMFHFQKGYGLPVDYEWIDVYKTSGGILFSTAKGVFRFNKQIKRFYQDTLLGIYFSDSKQWLFPVVEDKNKNLWFTSGQTDCYSKQTIMALFQGEGKKYRIIRSPFIKIRNYTIEDIYPDTNDIVWLASFDKVLRYDNKMMNSAYPAFHTILKKVVVGKDSLLPVHTYTYEKNKIIAGQIDSLIPVLPYRLNSFFFEFAAPSYQSEKQVVYSYILEGFNKNWSEWALLNKKEYTNLPEGAYTFKVKARDIFGNESAETAFSFSVQPPYYRTWWAYLAYLLILGSFVYMVIRWRNLLFEKERHKLEKMIIERTDEIVRQKERAEQLVANILPKETAEELKSAGRSARKKYKMVTVLFSDIHGFSNISDRANPDEILDELDKYFYHFDEVVERFHIEKVRTVGDTYMCAGGIPVKNRTNPIDVIMAALDMCSYMKEMQAKSKNEWNIRIGIHSGPVIAGMVGSKKLSFDIWGDTVNIAHRMESAGRHGEICISDVTYEIVHQYFICEFFRKIPVKYKGDISLYFVKGLKPEYSKEGKGLIPNIKFITKLQLIRFDDLDELVMTKLDKGLTKNLYYHNLKHTVDVITQVELIGRKEKIFDEDMLILKTAALFHDIGFLIGYDEHELLSIRMANEILPGYNYSPEQIQKIGELIYSTRMPPEPKNLLEQIMCDADLDYLGRTDFLPVSQNLFRELYEHGKIKTINEWNKLQLKFISGHQYFTQTARDLREENKKRQLEKIKMML